MRAGLAQLVDQAECAAVQALLPSVLDGHARAPGRVIEHVEHCLSCRAELARYRRMLGLLSSLESDRILPDGSIGELLAGLSSAAQRHAIRSTLSNRRAAYLAGLVVALVAASGIAVVALRHSAASAADQAEVGS